MSRNNKLYNYLVNNFGLSKKMIEQYVLERIEDLATKLNSEWIENRIRAEVDRRLDMTIINRLEHSIEQKVYKELQKELNKQLKGLKFEGKLDLTLTPELSLDLKMDKARKKKEIKAKKQVTASIEELEELLSKK